VVVGEMEKCMQFKKMAVPLAALLFAIGIVLFGTGRVATMIAPWGDILAALCFLGSFVCILWAYFDSRKESIGHNSMNVSLDTRDFIGMDKDKAKIVLDGFVQVIRENKKKYEENITTTKATKKDNIA
jgi:prepilin signal peptidase PulO-like enzyme (type II secretory pathway)